MGILVPVPNPPDGLEVETGEIGEEDEEEDDEVTVINVVTIVVKLEDDEAPVLRGTEVDEFELTEAVIGETGLLLGGDVNGV